MSGQFGANERGLAQTNAAATTGAAAYTLKHSKRSI